MADDTFPTDYDAVVLGTGKRFDNVCFSLYDVFAMVIYPFTFDQHKTSKDSLQSYGQW